MKKFITTILAIVFLLTGCNGVTENNSSNDISNDISSEESVESVGSVESTESPVVSSESSEVSDSSEENSESVSSETSSEESSEDISFEESREEDVSSQPDSSEEDNGDNDSSAPVVPEPPVGGGDNGNESKPEEDVSSPVESEPEKDESKVEDVSSVPDVSEPDVSEPDVPVAHVHSYTAKVKAATCTKEGYTEYTCECGDSYKADIVEALGHDWNEWEVVQQPTTTSEGIKLRGCYRCFKGEEASIPKIVVTITQADLDMMAEEALDELNDYRRANGLQSLVTGPIAHQMASERAVQLATDFSHNGATAVLHKYMYNPNDPAGSPKVGGENIAKSHKYNSSLFVNKENDLTVTGRGMISGFETSPGHWRDLMSADYTACGIGFYIEQLGVGDYNIYVCVLTLDKLYGADAQQ